MSQTKLTPELNVIDLDVQGMTCASCAARIEKKLNKVEGVQASVNYATERAHVVAPASTTVDQLIQVVQNTGYDASLPVPDAPPPDRAAHIKRKLIVSASLALPVILMAMIPALQFPGWQWVSLVLAIPVVFWAGAGFHKSAWVNLKHGATTMDTLISMGTLAAFFWSLFTLIFGDAGHIGMKHHWSLSLNRGDGMSVVYFEAAVGVITFILLGRWIEARSRQDAGDALRALLEVGAKTVTVIRDGKEIVIPIEGLKVGEEFVVKPGDKIPTDGVVIEGHSAVDNAVITGESVPVEVGPGSPVVGAAINTNGRIVALATAVGADTQLAQIGHLVEVAQTGKSQTQDLANKISSIFVPTVITISVITLIAWLIAGEPASFAITAAVSVLIISCPCALGLATPTALLAGSLRGSNLGIVIRGPEALEEAHQVRAIAMDKTGTITTGVMAVVGAATAAGVDRDELLGAAASVEQASTHPIARAILEAAPAHPTADQISNVPGRGIVGDVDGEQIMAGNLAMLAEAGITVPVSVEAQAKLLAHNGASLVYVSRAGRVLGVIGVNDQIAEGSQRAIAMMKEMGLRTVMVTGDNASAASRIASEVGVDEVRADVLPAQKFDVIKDLQADGTHVAMLGDGVNDAAALTQADLGVSMGTGTDVAIAASDLTLMRHDLILAVDAIRLSRRTLRTIHGNLFWAFFYNVIAIPVAALGFLNPMVAGAAMAFSSVFVVMNSVALRTFKPTAN